MKHLKPKLSSLDYLKIICAHFLFIGMFSCSVGEALNLGVSYQDMIEIFIFTVFCFSLFLSIRGYIRAWL